MTARLIVIPLLALAALFVAGFGPLSPETAPSIPQDRVAARWADYTPAFRPHICPFKGKFSYDPERVRCGSVLVPEDRRDPQSRLIRLSLAIFSKLTEGEESTPTAFLTGGPGQSAMNFGAEYFASTPFDPMLFVGDVVLVDQRGTGYSEAPFCRALPTNVIDDLLGPTFEAALERLDTCLRDARAQGIAVETYSTWHNALDFRDVRKALGYKRWNLNGVSYGTELAQAIMMVDAPGVRAAILDSVVPLGQPGWDLYSKGMRNGLDEFAKACAEQDRCAAAMGDIAARFEAVVRAYDEKPQKVGALDPEFFEDGYIWVDGPVLASLLLMALQDNFYTADLPVMLMGIEERNVRTLRTMLDVQDLRLDHVYGYGLYLVANCRSGGLSPKPALDAHRAREPFWSAMLTDGDWTDLCTSLNLDTPDPSAKPLHSDIPTLVLTGLWDTITPPQPARQLMERLPNGTLVELPFTGHYTGLQFCSTIISLSFLINPDEKLDTDCVLDMVAPAFVTGVYKSTRAQRLWRRASAIANAPDDLPKAVGAGMVAGLMLIIPFGLVFGPIWRQVTGDGFPTHSPAAWVTGAASLLALAGTAILADAVIETGVNHPFVLSLGLVEQAETGVWLLLSAGGAALAALALLFWEWARQRIQPVAALGLLMSTGTIMLLLLFAARYDLLPI